MFGGGFSFSIVLLHSSAHLYLWIFFCFIIITQKMYDINLYAVFEKLHLQDGGMK